MIIVKLIGGLGNQMFQYATGRALAYNNNMELKLDVSGYNSYNLWNYELGNYNINEQFATEDDLKCVGKPKLLFKKIIPVGKEAGEIECGYYTEIYYFKERHFYFDPRLSKQKTSLYLDGYWQSEKYFKNIEEILRSDFTLKGEISGSNLKIADKIQNSDSVSLHVRRGDYVSDPQTYRVHGVCSLEYYSHAVADIRSKVTNPHYFVFSDDPEWARENISLSSDVDYISCNNPSQGYEDLRLMNLCDHHIIANSSFSWWGAWLGKNKNGIVIAPKKWFNRSRNNTKDLLPQSWIRL